MNEERILKNQIQKEGNQKIQHQEYLKSEEKRKIKGAGEQRKKDREKDININNIIENIKRKPDDNEIEKVMLELQEYIISKQPEPEIKCFEKERIENWFIKNNIMLNIISFDIIDDGYEIEIYGKGDLSKREKPLLLITMSFTNEWYDWDGFIKKLKNELNKYLQFNF